MANDVEVRIRSLIDSVNAFLKFLSTSGFIVENLPTSQIRRTCFTLQEIETMFFIKQYADVRYKVSIPDRDGYVMFYLDIIDTCKWRVDLFDYSKVLELDDINGLTKQVCACLNSIMGENGQIIDATPKTIEKARE